MFVCTYIYCLWSYSVFKEFTSNSFVLDFFCSNFHIILIYNLIFLNISFNVRHEIQTIICLFLSFMAFLMGGFKKGHKEPFLKVTRMPKCLLSFPPSVKEECVYSRFFLLFFVISL